MWSLPTEPLHRACTRYGPGRLPGAKRPDVGAGYAAASAALAATVLFAATAIAGETIGVLSSNDGLVWFAFAGLALPIVIPTAFLVGVAVWRLLPSDVPFFGPVAGLLGTLGTYVASLPTVTVILTASAVPWALRWRPRERGGVLGRRGRRRVHAHVVGHVPCRGRERRSLHHRRRGVRVRRSR